MYRHFLLEFFFHPAGGKWKDWGGDRQDRANGGGGGGGGMALAEIRG